MTLHARVVDFLAVKIGSWGDSKSARHAVQGWLQSQIDRDPGAFVSGLGASRADRSYNAQRMMQLALDEIVDPTLRRKLDAAMEKSQAAERDR